MGRTPQILLSIFFGMLLALVLGLVTTTLIPTVSYDNPERYEQVALLRMILSLVLSIVVLIGGLFLHRRVEFFGTGMLLAALINLVTANVWGWSYDNDGVRLAAACVSLLFAGAAAWWFAQRSRSRPSTTASPSGADLTATEARLTELEHRLAAAAAALRGQPSTGQQPTDPGPEQRRPTG